MKERREHFVDFCYRHISFLREVGGEEFDLLIEELMLAILLAAGDTLQAANDKDTQTRLLSLVQKCLPDIIRDATDVPNEVEPRTIH